MLCAVFSVGILSRSATYHSYVQVCCCLSYIHTYIRGCSANSSKQQSNSQFMTDPHVYTAVHTAVQNVYSNQEESRLVTQTAKANSTHYLHETAALRRFAIHLYFIFIAYTLQGERSTSGPAREREIEGELVRDKQSGPVCAAAAAAFFCSYDANALVGAPTSRYSHTWKGDWWRECGEWRGREREKRAGCERGGVRWSFEPSKQW